MFACVVYMDWMERQVYLFLFPLIGFAAGYLFFKNTLQELFYMSIIMNLGLIFILMSTVFLYARYKLKTKMTKTIGMGDVLLLLFLCFTFSTISFIVVLISALIFSLIIHLVLKTNSNHTTVPLAGYLSLFFLITYVAFWSGIIDSLYSI